jgi:hypothetical protein
MGRGLTLKCDVVLQTDRLDLVLLEKLLENGLGEKLVWDSGVLH